MTFKVRLRPSGRLIEVEKDEAVLDAAMRQGVDLPYGCRNGACGSCMGTVLKGQIRYLQEPMALEDDAMVQGKALFCIGTPESDLEISVHEIEGLEDIQVRSLRCRVESKQPLSHDVMCLKLKLAGDERLQYLAGQYIEFILDEGKRRAFSIANAPHTDALIELHIRHVDGGKFTDYLFSEMPEKTMLRIEGPMGSFFLRENSDRPIILMGGGTGFGPLKAIMEHSEYIHLDRSIHLFMGVRAKRDLYMAELAKEWEKRIPNFKFTPVLSEPTPQDNWQGETGYVHEAAVKTYPDLSEFDIYMSGPPPMVDAGLAAFTQQRADQNHIYSDAFEYSADASMAMRDQMNLKHDI